jgi:hypothetical protein
MSSMLNLSVVYYIALLNLCVIWYCVELQQEQEILKNYIPGLHRPGENYPELPALRSNNKPKEIPEQLVSEYKSGRKNAVRSFVLELPCM